MICPVCKRPLQKQQNSYVCAQRHTFDIAASGYVNLLLSSAKNSKAPGDNKEMVRARHAFLRQGYFLPLANAIAALVAKHLPPCGTLLDLGCSEGYYTHNIATCLRAQANNAQLFGLDISKEAIIEACKTKSDAQFVVASAFDVPLHDHSVDMVLSVFAPYALGELLRLVKPNGNVLLVVPGKLHLDGIKKVLYDNPRFAEEQLPPLPGFALTTMQKLQLDVELSCQTDIAHLVQMTPYYYKSTEHGKQRLHSLRLLSTTLDFTLLLFAKK